MLPVTPLTQEPNETRMSTQRVTHAALLIRRELGRLGCREIAAMLDLRRSDAAELRELLNQEAER